MLPLHDAELDQLFDYFNDQARSDDCLDFYGLHGFLTAHVIGPVKKDAEALLHKIFDGMPDFADDTTAANITDLIVRLESQIGVELADEEQMAMPFVPNEKEDELEQQAWCAGFLELVFEDQDAWFQHGEESIATLMLPIETGSGLFDDEPDFKDIIDNKALHASIIGQIPEILVDLFLLINAKPESKTKH
jgi:uncharacterized protein